MRDNMLEGPASLSWADDAQKGFKAAPGQRSQTCRRLLVPQMRQKFGHGPAMVCAGRVRESSDLLQIRRVGRDALLKEAWCWLWKQRQLGVEILIQSAHQGREIGIFLRICGRTGPQLRACEFGQTPHVALL